METTPPLEALPRRTIAEWHRFVASQDGAVLTPLLAHNVTFRSPAVHVPICGREATLLVLTTVVEVFENFRYHREFVGGGRDVALEFSASVGKLQLKGVDLITFDEAGQMTDFEVMIRPLKALQAVADEMARRIGPRLAALKQAPQHD